MPVSQGSIVIGKSAGSFYRWVADELQHYLRLLSGAELPIVTTADAPADALRILLGGPASNELVAAAEQRGHVDFGYLKRDGFLLCQVDLGGKPALIAGGNDEASTMYAAYELLERLGVVFQITGDIIPERKPDLSLPPLQIRMEPVLKYRGLHLRHFVMPWMGLDDLSKLLAQLAKMKCNYLEFYWYVGAPWIEYSYRGEKRLIGDLYTRESGYTTWRINTATFTTADVQIGKEHFRDRRRACAPEFEDCETQEQAHLAARRLLKETIAFAHQRKIQVWLGKGDCPGVPPNLGRFAKHGRNTIFGKVVSPGDPVGLDVWTAAVNSMIDTYPEADGYWVWLAEGYYRHEDPQARQVIRQYDEYRKLIPSLDEIRRLGYDQYFRGMSQEEQIESDLSLLHYGKQIVDRMRQQHPSVRVGLALLGRAYLFHAMDTMFPKDVPFESMEASICWNRGSRVPMQLFGNMGERERLLVPRLDDDESAFAMQFNVGLYHHDQVLSGSAAHGVAGVAPQAGKLRGVEQNARFVFEGGWNRSLTPNQFYRGYAGRLFGPAARDLMLQAFQTLERLEMYLGLEAKLEDAHFFLGLGNFVNYADSMDIRALGRFAQQKNPFDGPDFPTWDVRKDEASFWMKNCTYRRDRFAAGIGMLKESLGYLRPARAVVLPGARQQLDYILYKTESYISHLEMLRALLAFFLAYDQAFRAKRRGDERRLLDQLDACQSNFARARDLARETAHMVAANAGDPTEKYILFRYNVRFILPMEEFGKFVRNVVNYHRGRPYWEPVNWDVISPPPLPA